MATDREGRLFIATKFGVQVFNPEGRLLGVVTFPDLPVDWDPKQPLSCAFGGSEMSTLYVACGDEIFAVPTRTAGFLLPAP
jgi:gluconolactonase